jgi:hypothetical protein
MATLVLGAAGAAIGGSIGGTILGVSAATIGGMVGSTVGGVVDSWIVSQLSPMQRIEGARLDQLQITSAAEGGVLPRLYGRMRIGGNIIWATDFNETIVTERTRVGGKGGGGSRVVTTTYVYDASFAVALCEGQVRGIGRVWADGELLDLTDVTWRWYPGSETQQPDPFIASRMGAATPAYRGVAYVVFEGLALEQFGNRIPQLSFEVFRPVDDPASAEGMARAVTLIPASGEFSLNTESVRRVRGGAETVPENANAIQREADLVVALDRLQAAVPGIESISLVVSWFGDDLRMSHCRIEPRAEVRSKNTQPIVWSVNGVTRASAVLVSTDPEGRPIYGGTPADSGVVQAIQECKARGLRVTFYPFILMDVPDGNSLPNPYSDAAEESGQPAFPWRGRITLSVAPGHTGSPDSTSAAASEVAAFFGAAQPGDFAVSATTVTWTGGADWGLRRFILHYAHLCKAAGGVDAFLIGSEMRGVTTVRGATKSYPGVAAFVSLLEAVRSVVGPSVKLSYAADWSEYFGHHRQGEVFFHLDPLWSHSACDFVGIDNYMPLADWRDGWDHLDAQGWESIHDPAYLAANIAAGEGYDWYYASAADRAAQVRSPISDGSAGKPWVFRYKDLRAWWSNQHFDRPGGVESGTPTGWVPQSKPIWFTELGCPSIDRGPNQPNVFYDPKSSESFVPHFSRGWRDEAVQRSFLEAHLRYWNVPANNPQSSHYAGRMVEVPEIALWTWDARPYPFFPSLEDVWSDGENWRLGHWLTGRLGAVQLGGLVRLLCLRGGLPVDRIDVSQLWGAVEGYVIGALESPRASIAVLGRHFGFDAFESEGRIVFRMRSRRTVATVGIDDLVVAEAQGGEPIEITRGQETELPQALKWQIARADDEYDPAVVEARRINVHAARVASEAFPIAVAPEEAERRVRRALMEAWTGRETAAFALPPSRLSLNPSDVVELDHDGRLVPFRLTSVADGEARRIEAVLEDRAIHDLPPGTPRRTSITRAIMLGQMQALYLDLPVISESVPEHQPYFASTSRPWPGAAAVWRSPAETGFSLVGGVDRPAFIGELAEPLPAGPASRFDLGAALVIDIRGVTLASVPDVQLFDGANAFALESAPGVWEILQAGTVELIAPARYRLTRLLRGQRGTEWAIADPAPAGATIVVLDAGVVPLPITRSEVGLEAYWRAGPASKPHTDETFEQQKFTPEGRGLIPFSVVHVEQPHLRERVPGDLSLRWTRRARALAADSWEGLEIPLGEDAEAYAVEILDGAVVLRTLAASGPSVVYSGAMQIADLGAHLAPGDSLAVRITQLSAFGPGTPVTVTLQF